MINVRWLRGVSLFSFFAKNFLFIKKKKGEFIFTGNFLFIKKKKGESFLPISSEKYFQRKHVRYQFIFDFEHHDNINVGIYHR